MRASAHMYQIESGSAHQIGTCQVTMMTHRETGDKTEFATIVSPDVRFLWHFPHYTTVSGSGFAPTAQAGLCPL